MDFFFNSNGSHLANMVRIQLHSPAGPNIGHYLPSHDIFIDMTGRYLGEIVSPNRLMYNRFSAYRYLTFGAHGNYGNIGSYGTPGNDGDIDAIAGYEDIDRANLKG